MAAPLRSLQKRALWLVLVTLLAAVFGAYLSSLRPSVYEATADVYLADPNRLSTFSLADRQLEPEEYVASKARRVMQRSTLDAASQRLHDVSADDLESALQLDTDPVSLVISITAEASSPELTAAMANATADAFRSGEEQSAAQLAHQAVDEMSGVLANSQHAVNRAASELASKPGNQLAQAQLTVAVERRVQLQTRIDNLRSDAALLGSGIQSVEEAVAGDQAPVAPNPLRDGALSGLLALVAGSGLVWFWDDRRGRVTQRYDAQAVLGAPLLGEVPCLPFLRPAPLRTSSSRIMEPYEFVMTTVHRLLEDRVNRTLVITSARPGDGKTTTALHLAMAGGRDGSKVLLIDGDLHRTTSNKSLSDLIQYQCPDLGSVLGAHAEELATGADTRQRLESIDSDNVSLAGLTFIPAGDNVADRSALLRSRALRSFLETKSVLYDFTLIDTPEVLTFSDAAAAASHADGVILVVTPGTSYKDLVEVRERLRLVDADIVGYVYNQRAHTPTRGARPADVKDALPDASG